MSVKTSMAEFPQGHIRRFFVVTRRRHPYFGRLNRRSEAGKPGPRQANARTPLTKPKDEPGVLWEAFRDLPPPPAD
jgi:hypothetical protein